MTGIIIFAATYALIAIQRVRFIHLNRPAAALLGAVAMVVLGVLTPEQARDAIDFDVIVFLLGLMLIVGYLEVGKFFEAAAEWAVERALTPRRLLFATIVGAGILSAFFVNDTICLVVTPVLLVALERLQLRPQPFLIALAMGANVGSVMAVTGNPQNMLIGVWSGVSFGGFFLRMLPVALGALAITYFYLNWAFRSNLPAAFTASRAAPQQIQTDKLIVRKALLMFGVALCAWLAGGSLPLVAITCGAIMVAIAQRDPADVIARIEWELLLLFASLFVVMRGLQQTGAVDWINQHALALAHRDSAEATSVVVTGVMVVLSSLISNVPAVMLWRDVVPQLPDPQTQWLILSMSSTFAGNLILIGSIANLIVAERAQARGVTIGFAEYAKVGVPVTVLTLAWGLLVLLMF